MAVVMVKDKIRPNNIFRRSDTDAGTQRHKEVSAMRLLIILMALACMFTAVVCFADDSMTCGTNLVSVGDLKPSIMSKCGAPYTKEDIGGGGTRERWTYNFGSGDFLKILTFDGDRLESIDTGEKGFDK